MSNQIIPVFTGVINKEQIQLVNARELHQFLEVTSRFNDWINNRIKEYKFIENVDYISFTKNLVKPTGGRPTVEIQLTMDMAKELSMVEHTDKGRQARKYFIECEKQLHNKTSIGCVTPNREILPKMVYHNKSASKPYRAYVYDMVLKKEVFVGTFATVNEALDAQKSYFENKPFTVAPIPYLGRWLVISNNHGIEVKNIDNYNCVNYTHFKKLQTDARTYARETLELLRKIQDLTSVSHEFLYRLKVLEGDGDVSRLNTPISRIIDK